MRWKSIWKLSRRKEVRVLKYCHILYSQCCQNDGFWGVFRDFWENYWTDQLQTGRLSR